MDDLLNDAVGFHAIVGFSIKIQKKQKFPVLCAYCGEKVEDGRYNVCFFKKKEADAGGVRRIVSNPELVIWVHMDCIPTFAKRVEEIVKKHGGRFILDTL